MYAQHESEFVGDLGNEPSKPLCLVPIFFQESVYQTDKAEPPVAEPHGRWCGAGGQRWQPLPH